jgi:hypothetical protein
MGRSEEEHASKSKEEEKQQQHQHQHSGDVAAFYASGSSQDAQPYYREKSNASSNLNSNQPPSSSEPTLSVEFEYGSFGDSGQSTL